MSLAIAGQPFGINYTALDSNNGLFVQAAVYDITGGLPGTLQTTINLVNTTVGSYDAEYTGIAGKTYKVAMAVYTDGTYTVLNPNYAPQSDMVQVIANPSSGGSTGTGNEPVLTATFVSPPVVQASVLNPPVLQAIILEE